MSPWVDILVLAACLVFSAAFSGSETAFYCVSRVRVEMEARQKRGNARIIQKLLGDDVALLIVLLIGNTLVIEIATYRGESFARALGLPEWAVEVALALVLTPLVFFFGEVLPKDLFRRRPHSLLAITAPFILCSRYAFYPIERSLRLITSLVTRSFGLEPRLLSVVRGREAVLRLLREGAESGAILPHAETLARNVLKLRSIEVERAKVPWSHVRTLSCAGTQAEMFETVAQSQHTRLPVVDAQGKVQGYVHQLDVLGAGPSRSVLEHMRPVIELAPHTPVDRALARLRLSGQRLAIVGAREKPEGLLTLKDLVEEISGDLAGL